MEVTRKPLAKIEGRKRMQASSLTVASHGTRGLKDWVAYVEDGAEEGRLVLADHVSERAIKRAIKSLLARIQTLSREDLRAMARQGGGPPGQRRQGGGEESPGVGTVGASASNRQLTSTDDGQVAERPRQRRLATAVGNGPTVEPGRPARSSARDEASTLRQLRSRVEMLEAEQEHLRAELAALRGETEGYDGPPSIFVTGWFRATLVLIVLAIVVVITVPWLMSMFDGGVRDPRPPARTEAPAPPPR